MAKFLRDEHLKNLNITEEILGQINQFMILRLGAHNQGREEANGNQDNMLLLTYIIRFDNRGYKLNDFTDVIKYYKQATKVERVIFTLDTNVSERTNRMYGTHFEIRFDSKDHNNSYIQTASDDSDAVDSVFNGLTDIVKKCKNRNSLVRNTWSQLVVQIFGVAIGFVLSLIAGLKASPFINIENSFVITFLFAFLIFSNAWGFINQQILRFVDFSFPNIRFSREGKASWHWLAQAFVAGIIVTITLIIFGKVFEWVGKVLGHYVG